MRIRAATDHDAQAIGPVHVEVWRFAYRDILPEAYLASLSPEERAGQWRSLLRDPGSTRFVLVVVNERDDVVGFAAAGPQRSDESEYQGELYALYVLPLHQRRGLGRALVRAVAHRLLAGGVSSMSLWVLEANAPARRFYEKLGDSVVRDRPIDIGSVTLTEVAYGWPRLGVLLNRSAADTWPSP
jgi:ribosomal protein S18 acetylase RimI-like enzyme